MDPHVLEEQLGEFLEWISENPELPQNFDKITLARYLKATDFDLEAAKKLFKNGLTIRSNYPHIFTQRDPYSPEIQTLIKALQYVPMPEKTPNNLRVTIVRIVDPEPDLIVFNDVIKMFFMCADIRLAMLDEFFNDGEVPIWDMSNLSIRHFPKIVFGTLRLFMKYTQEAHPVKVRQLHVINCSSLLNKALALVKPFLKAEVAERIHFHTPDSDTLYKYIPRDILPKELGGTYGSIDEWQNFMYQYLDSYRDYLMNDDNWRINNA